MSTNADDRYSWDAGQLVTSQCLSCRHLAERSADYPDVCRAFPAFIPQAILDNDFDHRQPHPDDGGVRFEPKDGVPPESLRLLYGRLDETHSRR